MAKTEKHWTEYRFSEANKKAVNSWGSVWKDKRGLNDESQSSSRRLINFWHDNILCK